MRVFLHQEMPPGADLAKQSAAGIEVIGGFGQYETDSGKRIVPDYSAYLPLATSDPAAMVDQLNLVLMGGGMSAQFRAQLLTSIGKVAAWPVNDVAGQRLERLKMALWLIINSPEYMIQK